MWGYCLQQWFSRSEKEAPGYSSVKPLNRDQAHKLLVELTEESEEDTFSLWMRFKLCDAKLYLKYSLL